MSHAEAVQAYLANKNATWSDDLASWTEDGKEHLLLRVDGPLNAETIVDAHVRALARGATLAIAPSGEATPVARRTAARFGITLLDPATLPQPAPHPAATGEATPVVPALAPHEPVLLLTAHEPAAFDLLDDIATAWSDALAAIERRDARRAPAPAPAASYDPPIPGFFRALEREPAEPIDASDAFAALDALAVGPTGEASPEVLLVASEGAPVALPAMPNPALEPVPTGADLATTGDASPVVVVAHSEAEPALAHADPALPWDLSLSAPEPEPVHVEAAELAAMPWNLHSEQHELLPAGRTSSLVAARPSQLAHEWGLPWPRPVVPTGGLAIADPKLWHDQERLAAVREDLNKVGAPSFGTVKPEGSAWLKRLHEFGAP